MTQEDYKNGINALEEQFKSDKIKLAKKFALSNNTVSVGSTITDVTGFRIKVESISVGYSHSGMPECIYKGIVINKNGSESKRGERNTIWQHRLTPNN